MERKLTKFRFFKRYKRIRMIKMKTLISFISKQQHITRKTKLDFFLDFKIVNRTFIFKNINNFASFTIYNDLDLLKCAFFSFQNSIVFVFLGRSILHSVTSIIATEILLFDFSISLFDGQLKCFVFNQRLFNPWYCIADFAF